jgi:23S rRNA (guanosine2251-2'-O)-methyltransferase
MKRKTRGEHRASEGRESAPVRRPGTPQASSLNRIHGVNPVLEALRSGRRSIEHIAIAEGARDERLRELLELARSSNVPVRRVSAQELDRDGGNLTHQGVVARIAAAQYSDAEALLDELASQVAANQPPLALCLDGLEDPRNFGAVLRTAECAGVRAVFTTERRAVGLTETAAKASAGALEYISVARVVNLSRLIEQLKERNIWVVGTAGNAAREYTDWDWTQPTAVFVGNEGTGLHRLVRERCDLLVRIPTAGHLESLNVSVATGVVLYEALRQRRVAGERG